MAVEIPILLCWNRYPYNNGHLYDHPAGACRIAYPAYPRHNGLSFWSSRAISEGILQHPSATCLEIGLNLGRLPVLVSPSITYAVVPRWAGDTNYMTVIREIRSDPATLDEPTRYSLSTSNSCSIPLPTPEQDVHCPPQPSFPEDGRRRQAHREPTLRLERSGMTIDRLTLMAVHAHPG